MKIATAVTPKAISLYNVSYVGGMPGSIKRLPSGGSAPSGLVGILMVHLCP